MKKRATIIISGDVQDVGFRGTVMRLAQKSGLVGYAENLPDGSVRAICEGEEKSIKVFARKLDIRAQFMLEAVGISLLGGIIGVGLGYGISRLVAAYSGWSTIITPESIALSFGVSSVVGLVFGIYPAVQASNLDPIECLRYE